MKTYLTKIEAFDGKFFPDGVTFNLAPITLFGGSFDGLYFYEAVRSLWQMTVFKSHYDFTKVVAHKDNDVFSIEYFENENARNEFETTKAYHNGDEIVDWFDEIYPLLNDQRQIDESKNYDHEIKDTNIHWVPSMWQECDRHPRTQWQYINDKITEAKEKGTQLLIDANSDITYNAVRILIKNGVIVSNDVVVYYFATDKKLGENGYCGDIITFDENGNPSQTPDGFLTTYEEQLSQLI